MKYFIFLFALVTIGVAALKAGQSDSVYLFAYSPAANNNHHGLQFAWSRDQQQWQPVGTNGYAYLWSDYSRWGTEKRMIDPFLFRGSNGNWECVWALNETVNSFAHAGSKDLIQWGRQIYPALTGNNSIHRPVVQFDEATGQYSISYSGNDGKYFSVSTEDFRKYSSPTEIKASSYRDSRVMVNLPDGKMEGTIYLVTWSTIAALIKEFESDQYKSVLSQQTTKQDSTRFAKLKNLQAIVELRPQQAKPISDMLTGVFFEDINYAADGGLYAELLQNRDFEYDLMDKEGKDSSWNSMHSWIWKGSGTQLYLDSIRPIHPNNPHYLIADVTSPGGAITNSGYDGINVKKDQRYSISFHFRSRDKINGRFRVSLVNAKGEVIGQTILQSASKEWRKLSGMLTVSADATDAVLTVRPLTKGRFDLDLFSLMPEKTFRNRKNGLRNDLAETIAAIRPRFVRFPGGCVAHGDGLGNIYHWKNTIGPLESRKPQRNLWGYHQTAGLGYFEYFQFCEDIGATPVPVVAAAVPCQNSATGGGGQQGGIPMAEMDSYIQDILDLVEYANADIKTTWGRKRAEAGHPLPFNLKYIGIGNEDLITDVFEERFRMIYSAMQKKHPEITVIGTVGPSFQGTDYDEGWKLANELSIPMVDEHYYQSPGWFINNQDYYDKYDRRKSKVYLGEYAAHLPGRPNNLETALAEALYLTALERNADVVSMASYAPLLAKTGHTQWNPNLIYFDNQSVSPTTGYYVQQLNGQAAGDKYIPCTISLSETSDAVRKRIGIAVTKNSSKKEYYIKLVNLLPVAVSCDLKSNALQLPEQDAIAWILTGEPSSLQLAPKASKLHVAGDIIMELPAYSYTVITVKGN